MTIKQFSRLCNCNPQTLRYYDKMDLLKPVKVDPYSGYRFYDKEQALAFVKIKNLQAAGFTIGEIKSLLDKDNQTVSDAFRIKIEELERKLETIRSIRMSYQKEMLQTEKLIQETKKRVELEMRNYSAREEFGISETDYLRYVKNVGDYFEQILSTQDFSNCQVDGEAMENANEDDFDFLHDPSYELVYEKHGWQYVKEFFDEFCHLEEGKEYALCFETVNKNAPSAFCNTVLGMLLDRMAGKKTCLGCNVNVSKDGRNHFRLFLRRN